MFSKLKCKKSGHLWNGCTCEHCSEVRDEGHTFEETTIMRQYDENGCEIDHEIKPWDDLYGAPITYHSFKAIVCIKCGMVQEETETE